MVSRLRFAFLFAFTIFLHSFVAAAPLAPETIKQHVEAAQQSNYVYSGYPSYTYTYNASIQTYTQVAQNVITNNATAKLFKQYSLQDILSWVGGSYFFRELCITDASQKIKDQIIDAIATETEVQLICSYISDEYYLFEQLLINASPAKATKFANLLFSASQSNGAILHRLMNYTSESAQNLLKPAITNHLKAHLKNLSLATIITENTPTAIHMLTDPVTTFTAFNDVTTNYAYYKAPLTNFLSTVIKEEKRLIGQGYTVFFHSQRWNYLLVEKLYTDLWALTSKKNRPQEYLFPHVRIKKYDPLAKGPLSRESILQTGRTDNHDRQALLFVNNSLFGKYRTDCYSSALHFFLYNDNINHHIKITPEQIFEHYKLKKIFTKYQAQIATIETLFDQARTLGTLLLIAIPNTMLKDYCYAAIPGGYKNTAAPDINIFLDELAQQGKNKINNEEFCIIMLDEAMNPEGGLIIKPFHCADTTYYQQFTTEYEKLMTTLQKEIARD